MTRGHDGHTPADVGPHPEAKSMDLLGQVCLLGRPGSVTVARMYTRTVLMGIRREAVEDAELLVAELVANAAKHSRSGCEPGGVVTLKVYGDGHTVRVEVIDQGSGGDIPPIPAQVDPMSECGRGLWLVRELSSAWGWGKHGAGRIVWFELTSSS